MQLQLDDGRQIEASIRPLKIGEYSVAYTAWRAGDEPRLLTMVLVPEGSDAPMPKAITPNLTQASYNDAVNEMRRVNAGFFGYCTRVAGDQAMQDPAVLARVLAEYRSTGGLPTSGLPQV
jgi:hypothetical protein